MAKSRKRKISKAKASGQGMAGLDQSGVKTMRRPLLVALALLACLAVAAFGYSRWSANALRGPFEALLAANPTLSSDVRSFENLGREHLQPGQNYNYTSEFPTSGPHAPVPTDPGFYDDEEPKVELVHALEHGHIVIYYEEPGAEAISLLKDWTRLYPGLWDGVVVVPKKGLGTKIVLTAWRKRLDMNPFNPGVAARFIDTYRGRGPENAVR